MCDQKECINQKSVTVCQPCAACVGAQKNYIRSGIGTIKGLHFSTILESVSSFPSPQGVLFSCLCGCLVQSWTGKSPCHGAVREGESVVSEVIPYRKQRERRSGASL